MNMRKLVAVLLSVMMLVGYIPSGSVTVAEDFAASETVSDTRSGSEELTSENTEKAVKAKKIQIEGPKNVAKGKKVTLKATVSPKEASQKVVWSTQRQKDRDRQQQGRCQGCQARQGHDHGHQQGE